MFFTGVWHPDSLIPEITWLDDFSQDQIVCGYFINPFLETCDRSTQLTESFTEQLPRDCASLQWALAQQVDCDILEDRGNKPLSGQDKRPLWLSKSQYFIFSSFRNYPRLQLRKIATAMSERSLDFGHPAVHTLIQQTLFHVGPILLADKCHSCPYPEWRTDLHIDANDEFCTDLAGILRQTLMAFADDISEAPRDHRTLLLISIVADYFSQWDESFREVTRHLASAAMKWSREVEEQIEAANTAEQNKHFLALSDLQCLYNMYAIAAHHHGDLTDEEGKDMIILACLVRKKLIFEDKTIHYDDIHTMKVVCTKVMLSRAGRLLDILTGDTGSAILSKVIQLVMPQQGRGILEWKMIMEVAHTMLHL